jgi:hypothetical protein
MHPRSRLALLALFIAPLAAAAVAAPPASLAEAIVQGKFTFNARLRWEEAQQSNLKDSDACTLRTRLGYTSASIDGFQAMIEGENVASFGDTDDYNAAGTNPGGAGRAAIADPTVTDLNQAWLSYTSSEAVLKVGRQRIVLDNARFVGDVGWRQNMQTFDAADVAYKPAGTVSLFYGYVWRVSRVFGNKTPQPDFKGDAHLLNASYSGWSAGKLTAYAYLLDFDNSAANSSDTYGASFVGAQTPSAAKEFKVTYRLEYATQSDAGKNPVSYRADYYVVALGGALKPFDFAVGYEVLGSDNGHKGFATPLATLHAFDGWADLFLNTPVAGLRDLYATAGIALPGGFPVKIAYHDFTSDVGSLGYGHEWDAQVTHQIGKRWTLLAKVARYEAGGPFFDTDKFWLQTEFDF